MLALLVSRLAQGIVVLFAVTLLTFALLGAAGGDAVSAVYDDPRVSAESLARLRAIHGLDRPFHVRYARWLTSALGGDLGTSIYFQTSVGSLLAPRLARTLALGAAALLLSLVVAFSLGVAAARRRGSWADRLSAALELTASSTPRIVLALVALVLAARWALFESGGAGGTVLRFLLAAVVLAAPLVAIFLAQVRDGLGEALREDFVQLARAKGLRERVVLVRHAMRAALNPVITVFGFSLGSALSGSVIVETVLGWPGVGQLSVAAVRARDVPLLMGIVLATSLAVLVGNLVADVLLHLNDPRVASAEKKASARAAELGARAN
ncbi:MAG TPA: ABC transporter permease [Pyrinomonadaceae bacterium]|nr:ABC transporter permease [Pyrinomonadaceae bacterium]